jgi:hypothetical protein
VKVGQISAAALLVSGLVSGLLPVVVGGGLAACGNRRRENRDAPHDAQRVGRVIEPSPDPVGPLPPYSIRADGVGPYKLGDKMSDLLERLASGPRIALFEIPGVVHRNVIRAEDDTILIGGEQAGTALFVAVVGTDVARTAGVHVGSTRDELVAALGPPIDDARRAHDPRLLVPSTLPNLQVVLDGERVAAIVVTSATPPPRASSECPRPEPTEKPIDERSDRTLSIGACMTGAGELIQVEGDQVAIRSADGERALAPPLKFPALRFAAPLRGGDGRDELVVVTRSDEAAQRSWWVHAFRFEGARLVRTIEAAQVYQLSTTSARWIGAADVRDVELYLELTSRPDGIEVGGLLTTLVTARGTTKIRDVVVISQVMVPRRRGKSAVAEASDAGVPVNRATPSAAHDAPAGSGGESETSRP